MHNDVTQADRDLVDAIYEICSDEGQYPTGRIAQAIAAHRIAHEAPLIAERDALQARVAELEGRLIAEIEDAMWTVFNDGAFKNGQWSHNGMSDGEGLCAKLGLDPKQFWHDEQIMRDAIPIAAVKLAKEPTP